MNTLILFASSHGATEEAAVFLEDRLGDARVLNLKEHRDIDLAPFDTVVIGGSIHAGHIQRTVRRFVDKNESLLLQKRLGLYLCCMYDGETALQQFENAFPSGLRAHATATGLFGGRFDFEKMTFIERAIVKKVAGVSESVSKMNRKEMARFADSLAGQT